MPTNTGKAVFASLAIHAGVVAAAVQFWQTPVREPGTGAECLAVCLFSPPPEAPLLAAVDEEVAVYEVNDEDLQPEPEVAPVPAPIPAVIKIQPEVKIEMLPQAPPSTPIPSRVVETLPPKASPASKATKSTAQSQPPSGTRADAPASGTKSKGAGTATIPPRLTSKSAPRYRETADMRGKRLTVWLTLEVDERGRVSTVRVKHGCGYGDLDDAAAAAAMRYRFAPAHAGGSAVAWTFDHAVTFAL